MKGSLSFLCCLLTAVPLVAAVPAGGYYNEGLDLYKAGRNSEAIDAFEQAMKHKEHSQESKDYIDRILKETVERIRNKALTGINKNNWQTKYYFMNQTDKGIHVGISTQEVFERDSVNFRPGAIDALYQLGQIFAKADNAHFEVELINEVNPENPPSPTLTAQQLTSVFSYLSLASRDSAPKF